MKFHRFLGGIIHEELYFEEINIKFLIHKSLISENTRDMINQFIYTGSTPVGVEAKVAYDIVCFQPIGEGDNLYLEANDDYLWFVM
ncbi:MAG: hypothetical protein ACOX5F_03330 [Anaerovoracaceae bacterium]|jgi:hypothetical protein